MKDMSNSIRLVKSELTSHFDNKFEQLTCKLNGIDSSLSTLGEHVEQLEHRVGANEDNLTDMTVRVKNWRRTMPAFWTKWILLKIRAGLVTSVSLECRNLLKAAICCGLWPDLFLNSWDRKTSPLRQSLRGRIAIPLSGRMRDPPGNPSSSSWPTSKIK